MIRKVFAILSIIFSFTSNFNFASQSAAVKMEDDVSPQIGYLPPLSNNHGGSQDGIEEVALSQFTAQYYVAAAQPAHAQQQSYQSAPQMEPWHSLPMPQLPADIYGAAAAIQYNQSTAATSAAVQAAAPAPSPLKSNGRKPMSSTQQVMQQQMAAHQAQTAVLSAAAAAQSSTNSKTSAATGLRRSQRQKMKKEDSEFEDNESESSESEDDRSDDGDSDATAYEGEDNDDDSNYMEVVVAKKPIKNNQKGKAHPCSWKGCTKSFPKPSALKRHFRTHTGERPFACEFDDCDKRFAEKGNLKRHMRVHTGEKPYLCTKCADKFARLAHLQTHLKSKH